MLKDNLLLKTSRILHMSPRRLRQTVVGYAFISPGIFGITCFLLGPMIFSLWLCLTKWDIVTPPQFVGLQNFQTMLRGDEFFWLSLWVTLKYTIVAVPLNLVAAFAVALLLNANVKGMPIFRTLYYLPSITPAVASVMLWRWIFNTDFGLLNLLFQTLGLPKIHWLFDPGWVMPALWLMGLWGVGPTAIIYLAGLQGVPRQLYEAAEIDGANGWSKFWNVTMPMMSPVIFFNLVMGIIGTFQVFTAGYLMTGGGPQNSTLFYVLYTFRNAFQWLKMGYAAALAWVLFLIILVLTVLVFRSMGSRVFYGEA